MGLTTMTEWHGGKGSKPRPISDRQKFEENWDRIFNKKEDNFWSHRCHHNGLLMIGKNESCSWCGAEEHEEA